MTEYYNPYKLFVGAFVPNWLLERKEISAGAKLCFARLSQYAGEKGTAFPFTETLAKDLAVSRQQLNNYLKELEKYQLIERKQQGLGKPNIYQFLTNTWFTTDVKYTLQPDVKDTLHPIDKEEENHIRESYISTDRQTNSIKNNQVKEYEKEFEIIWANYPKRYGPNPKSGALRGYIARRKEKESYATIFKGAINYRDWCKENSKTNTEYVMMASKFLGRDKYYLSFQAPMKKRHWSEGVTVDM